MEKKLLSLFPEFGLIQDVGLRDRTLACWMEAMKLGGWQVEDLDTIPFTLLIPDCRVSFRTHVQAVTQTAIASAKILSGHYAPYYTLSMDLIVSGGLLHDIGKLLEYRRVEGKFVKSSNGKLLRHPFSGANLAARHLLPDEIVHIIAVHAKEGDGGYRTPEAVIVHHADFMNFEPLKG
ncbi:MAG TPA: HD domain-containing protein [bacterium]|nr:HD domain-containing protein [bacterium]HOY43173.1 HD domain-containing protein [bacterium]HPG84414.1 HD domain-containing protein [bacterium]HPM59615.1 HD domain-containing protein [bacterium]